jgi:hypothetical protein
MARNSVDAAGAGEASALVPVMGDDSDSSIGGLSRVACSAQAVKSLPRFDVHTLSSYLEDRGHRDLQERVYNLFLKRPELIPPAGESMSKEEATPRPQHLPLEIGIRHN